MKRIRATSRALRSQDGGFRGMRSAIAWCHTCSRLSLIENTRLSSMIAAAHTAHWPPGRRAVQSAFRHPRRCHVATDNHDLGAGPGSSARTLHCSSVGSLGHQHHPAGAGPPANERRPGRDRRRPPVTTHDAPGAPPMPFDTSIVARDSRSTNLRSPRHAITSSWRDPPWHSREFGAQRGQRVLCGRPDRPGWCMSGCSKASTRGPFAGSRRGCSRLVVGNESAPVTSSSR